MLMRYFLKLAYDGAPFHGWQEQPNANSVQQTLREAMEMILRHPVSLTGAGRTDTGVNARIMYAHFDTDKDIADSKGFLRSLNHICGRSIAVEKLIPVADDAHARFDATERTYRYFIIFDKSPFLRSFAWHCSSGLDIDKMNIGGRILIETDDFTSFAKLHSDSATNICHVSRAEWNMWDNDYKIPGLCFTITADRFLRNMVRAIVGTMVDLGRGKLSIEDFRKVIEARDRCAAGTSMPPEALFLWDIRYPYIHN